MQMTKFMETLNVNATLEEKVSFLKQPGSYPFHVSRVETKETHMSWVFLVDGFAYKLKKPVKYRFLDFSLLEARFRNCREEVRLNKRLAKDIYLGIVPLTVDEKGAMALQGKGAIIDWLVLMKKIPEEHMLDHAIKHHAIDEALIRQAAILLTEFYISSSPVVTDSHVYWKKLKGEVHAIYRELVNSTYQLPVASIELYTSGLLRFLNERAPLFDKRVKDGRIIEAHGDLRPEHICLQPAPAFIDCLEFNRDLRILDTAEELSFLSMECEMWGDTTIGKIFFDTYASLANDPVPEPLICFYMLKKACLRAFLVVRHITEPEYKDDPKWIKRANAYLQLAEQYYKQMGVE